MSDRCIFVDVSLYQPNMDWKVLAEKGVTGAILKASSGSYRKDALFLQHASAAHAAGLVLGAYHWCDPTNNAITQAQNFLSAVKGQPISFLAVDMEQFWASWVEYFERDITTLLSGEEISDSAYGVASYLVKNSGLPVIIYTRASFVADRAPQAAAWLPNFPLWLAYYPYSRVRISATWEELREKHLPVPLGPLLPKNCTRWTFWQFSGDKFRMEGAGGSLLDLNFFNGDRKALEKFIHTGLPPVIVAPQPALPRRARTLANLNLRSEPRVATDTRIGRVIYNTLVEVKELRQVGVDKWARIGENEWLAMEYKNATLMIWA